MNNSIFNNLSNLGTGLLKMGVYSRDPLQKKVFHCGGGICGVTMTHTDEESTEVLRFYLECPSFHDKNSLQCSTAHFME